jgi:DNA-binding MarR family transcriptional regulator
VRKLAERRTAEIVLLDEALRVMRVVWSLEHAVQSTSKRMERSIGVTGPQRLAMRVVGTLPGITPAELARTLHLDPSTVSGVLRRLVGKKLMARDSDPADRRQVRLRLTTRGEKLNRPSRIGTLESAIRAILATFPDAKIRSAVEVIERLSAELSSTPGRRARV